MWGIIFSYNLKLALPIPCPVGRDDIVPLRGVICFLPVDLRLFWIWDKMEFGQNELLSYFTSVELLSPSLAVL